MSQSITKNITNFCSIVFFDKTFHLIPDSNYEFFKNRIETYKRHVLYRFISIDDSFRSIIEEISQIYLSGINVYNEKSQISMINNPYQHIKNINLSKHTE